MEHVLSLSYGKDSMACLFAIEELGWKLDRIVHAGIWATDTVPADLPEMVEFKKKADAIIKGRWVIEVEHYSAGATDAPPLTEDKETRAIQWSITQDYKKETSMKTKAAGAFYVLKARSGGSRRFAILLPAGRFKRIV